MDDQGLRQKTALVDTHTHLDVLDDLFESLQQAKKTGVEGIIAVGVDVEANKKIFKLAELNHG
jgi:Tat protein secretion system quality control protein TatD with DNase activity